MTIQKEYLIHDFIGMLGFNWRHVEDVHQFFIPCRHFKFDGIFAETNGLLEFQEKQRQCYSDQGSTQS